MTAKYSNGRAKSDRVVEAEDKMLQARGGVPHHKAAQDLRKAYMLDCDDPTVAAVEWSNDPDATIDDDGDLWVHGHWASAEEEERFVDWLHSR